jgi:protein-arginine kinase activator protein McsA
VVRLHGTTTDHKKGKNMKKVDLVDCVKQIIAINKELEEHDQRQDYHVTYMAELRNRIEKLEKLQASSSKQQG